MTLIRRPIENLISINNSTSSLLTSGESFTGAWEDVTDYNTAAVSVLGSIATDGVLYFDLSMDGGTTFNSVPNPVGDTTFFLPRILNLNQAHLRIRYVNGTTAQTGTFNLQTKYSLSQQMSLLSSIDGGVNGETPTTVVKAVTVGANPNGDYVNLPQAGIDNNNTTSTPLGIAGVFTGAWSDVTSYGEIKVAMVTDEIGDCELQLSHDGVTVNTSLSLPPQLHGGDYTFIHALNPSLPYFRVKYTNGATAQSSFNFTTTLLVSSGAGFVSRTTQVIDKYTDARVIRQANDPTLDRNLGLLNYQVSARKFGKNNSVGNASLETVWSGADLGGVSKYVFAQAAETLRIKAGGNAADTAAGLGAQSIRIIGLDQDWNEAIEIVATAGASASVATTTTFIAVNKVQVVDVGTYGVANTGTIVVENTSTGTELAYVPAGVGNTQQAIFSVPAGKTAYVTKIKVSVGLSDSADIVLYHIDKADDVTGPTFGAKHYEWGLEDFSGSRDFDLDTYLKFDEKNHIYMEAQRITGSGTAQVSVDFEMYLVDN